MRLVQFAKGGLFDVEFILAESDGGGFYLRMGSESVPGVKELERHGGVASYLDPFVVCGVEVVSSTVVFKCDSQGGHVQYRH